jgi:hypothetical protein
LLYEIDTFCNSIWNNKELPAQWKESNIATIHKEGDKTDCSSYRRISLPSTSFKSIYNILLSRLSSHMDEVGDFSMGFSVTDELLIKFLAFFLSAGKEKQKWEYYGTVHQLFIDFKKTYYSVRKEIRK